ncbi:fatty acyl-AMP ligase [Pseudomonas sp. 09C 129]|uniref:fatty acyl-AMP ligase n=1 Tax=Pseudomonas sp. 09C 129 TaxID=2054915 RepID=UPI0012FED361|nr:fatty acyl-AMP ligase [Pseudomonas sp. 09C 129]
MSSIIDKLCERARTSSSQRAFEFLSSKGVSEQVLDYAELKRSASRVAAMLKAAGAGVGERVLILCQPGPEYVTAFFGCLYAGAVAVPLFPPRNRLHVSRVVSILNDAQASLLLCNAKGMGRYGEFFSEMGVPDSALLTIEASERYVEGLPEPAVQLPENTAFLQYTSGSTGNPKGVMVSNRNIEHNLGMLNEWLGGKPGEVMVSWLPPYHDMGLIAGLLAPVMAGYPCVLMPPETFAHSPFVWLDAISRYRATISGAPNFAYSMCCQRISNEQLSTLDLGSWRHAFNGAEPVRARTMAEFSSRFAASGFDPFAFAPCYGLAESTLIVTGYAGDKQPSSLLVDRQILQDEKHAIINQQFETPQAQDSPVWRSLVSVGPVIGQQKLLIVDPETASPCAERCVGEICVSGPSVARGYWQQAQASNHAFQSVSDQAGEVYLRSGDLGFLHEGELYVTGRLKDMIIIAGRNFYSEDIEQSVVTSQPKVVANGCAAFVSEHDVQESLVIVAEVERTQRHGNLQDMMMDIQKEVWMKHEINPQAVVLVSPGQVPRTSSGKVRRKACRQAWESGELKVLDHWAREPLMAD